MSDSHKSSRTNTDSGKNYYTTGKDFLEKYNGMKFYKIIHHFEMSHNYEYKENAINIEDKFDDALYSNGLHFILFKHIPEWCDYYGKYSTKIVEVKILPDGRYIDLDNKFKGDKIYLCKFESLELFFKNNHELFDVNKCNSSYLNNYLHHTPILQVIENNLNKYHIYRYAKLNNHVMIEKCLSMNVKYCSYRLLVVILKYQNFELLKYISINVLQEYKNMLIEYCHHKLVNEYLVKINRLQLPDIKKKLNSVNIYDLNDNSSSSEEEEDEEKEKNNFIVKIMRHKIINDLSISDELKCVNLAYNQQYNLILFACNYNYSKILFDIPNVKHHLTFENAFLVYHFMRICDYKTLDHIFTNIIKFDDIKHNENIMSIIYNNPNISKYLLMNKYINLSDVDVKKLHLTLDLLNIIFDNSELKRNFILDNVNDIVINIIVNNDVKFLNYLVNDMKLTCIKENIKTYFILACNNKNYDIAKYLFAIEYDITNNLFII